MEQNELKMIRQVTYPSLPEQPVALLQSRLYQDAETGQMTLYLDMQNVSDKTVDATYVNLCCFDEEVQLVSTKNREPFESLKAEPGTRFGEEMAIPLSSFRIRSITATVQRVCFSDGSVWNNGEAEKDVRVCQEDTPLSVKKPKKKWKRWVFSILFLLLVSAVGVGVGYGYNQWTKATEEARNLLLAESYQQAEEAYAALQQPWLPEQIRQEFGWYQALCAIKTGDFPTGIRLLAEQPTHAKSVSLLRQMNTLLSGTISAGEAHTVGLCADGTAKAIGENQDGQCEVSDWRDLLGVSAGWNHTLGFTAEGKVLYAGSDEEDAQVIATWEDAVAVSAGGRHSVAVLANGRVVAAGDNRYNQCDTQNWSGIVAVAAGRYHTVGLRQDGTVLAIGNGHGGSCRVEDWKDIVSIAAGDGYTLGVTKDGKVLAAGAYSRYGGVAEIEENAVSVFAGGSHAIAKRKDGTLQSGGSNTWHQSDVMHWENLLSAEAGTKHTVAISADGNAFAMGDRENGQCDVDSWKGMGLPRKALRLTSVDSYLMQIKVQ